MIIVWSEHTESAWFTQHSDYAGLDHNKPKNTTFIALVGDPDMGCDKKGFKTLDTAKNYIESLYRRIDR